MEKMHLNTSSTLTFLLLIVTFVTKSLSLTLINGNVTLILNTIPNNGMSLELYQGGIKKITGQIGTGISLFRKESLSSGAHFASRDFSDISFEVLDSPSGFNLRWQSADPSVVEFRDCFLLNRETTTWFTGHEGKTTEWPTQNIVLANQPHVISNDTPISEPYWLNSDGVFIFVNETTPLFVDQNSLQDDNLCLIGRVASPFVERSVVMLNYTIGAEANARDAHFSAILNYLGRPVAQPATTMVRESVWSTGVKFQKDINDQLLVDFAQSIRNNEFRGQVQIEDGWEECYGSLTFKKSKLSGINSTIITISTFALRTTLWIHPFVNDDCSDLVSIGKANDYFVKDLNGDEVTYWWNGKGYLIDFSNERAKAWFDDRVTELVEKHRLDGFKFSFGEISWAPPGALIADYENGPNSFTQKYNSYLNITTSVNVHSGWRTQWVPVFVSIPEKQPNWSLENGLKSVIVNLIQLNVAGYTFVMPGLIGGGGGSPEERPTPELYIRWVQMVTLMPVMQFGFLPWEIISPQFDVLEIVNKFVDLHSWYSDKIINVMKKCQSTGLPVNAPVWWIDSANPEAFKITDQFMLGEDFLVAPIVEEGAVSRNIYLPPGMWEDGNNYTIYEGGRVLQNYDAPIDILPYFLKQKDDKK